MSYTKQTGIPCDASETVVKLDTGDLVAVQCPCVRNPQTNQLVYSPQARAITAAGVTRTDADGRPIQTGLTHASDAAELTRVGADAISKECMLLVLGEPLTADPAVSGATIVPFSAANIAQQSIRNAIASAVVVTPSAGEIL